MSRKPVVFSILFEHERDGEPYQFDLVGVARRSTDGKLFWSTDSGCSCPSPWENHIDGDWEPLPETLPAFEAEAREGNNDPTEFLRLVKEELAKNDAHVAGGIRVGDVGVQTSIGRDNVEWLARNVEQITIGSLIAISGIVRGERDRLGCS